MPDQPVLSQFHRARIVLPLLAGAAAVAVILALSVGASRCWR